MQTKAQLKAELERVSEAYRDWLNCYGHGNPGYERQPGLQAEEDRMKAKIEDLRKQIDAAPCVLKQIKVGDAVTVKDHRGKVRTGKAQVFSEHYQMWMLDMGKSEQLSANERNILEVNGKAV
jgi:hypothetical protein